MKKTAINERIFMEVGIGVREVKLWPRVLREEAVRTLRCGGRR